MIANALNQIQSQLNGFLVRQFDLTEDLVVLSNLADSEGRAEEQIQNKVALTLVNITRETNAAPARRPVSSANRNNIAPPLYVNAYLLISANFGGQNYPEALKILSTVIGYFQGARVMDHSNTPDLNAGIDRLVLEYEDLSLQELNNIWSVHGGKYVPSALYRLRVVAISPDMVKGEIPVFSKPETNIGNNG